MAELVVFEESRIAYRGVELYTGRSNGRDVIVAKGEAFSLAELDLGEGRQVDGETIYVASYQNMLTWERELAPARRLVALNASGYRRGFGAGNRIVVSEKDVPDLGEPTTLGGWDGIHRAMARSAAPFWYVQQSIVRELIPEGVDPADYPGIGHTGGYGPRELLRAGLFAFASQGGYTRLDLPIGADADHAIIVGRDEETLAASIAFNKLAIDESQDYTKFTVDTSHLFDFPVALERGDLNALRDIFPVAISPSPTSCPTGAAFAFATTTKRSPGLAASTGERAPCTGTSTSMSRHCAASSPSITSSPWTRRPSPPRPAICSSTSCC